MTPVNDHWSRFVGDCETQNRAYVIVTVLGARGSTPRDSGTKMVVTQDSFCGTIGGGTLEYSALQTAQDALRDGINAQRVENYPLGEKLGQCCGGSTSLLFECFVPQLLPLYLFGAGHVGRALAPLLSTLPFQVHWVDERAAQFPDELPRAVRMLHRENPVDVLKNAAKASYFVIMTHQHPLDFALLEAALRRNDSAYIGVIGSASKWRRFKMRLAHREFDESLINSVHCPIGLPVVPGKQPEEIAVSVAAQLIGVYHARRDAGDGDGDGQGHEHGQGQQKSTSSTPRWKTLREQLGNSGVSVQTSTTDSNE